MPIDAYSFKIKESDAMPMCGSSLSRELMESVLDVVLSQGARMQLAPRVMLMNDRASILMLPHRGDEIDKIAHNAKVRRGKPRDDRALPRTPLFPRLCVARACTVHVLPLICLCVGDLPHDLGRVNVCCFYHVVLALTTIVLPVRPSFARLLDGGLLLK